MKNGWAILCSFFLGAVVATIALNLLRGDAGKESSSGETQNSSETFHIEESDFQQPATAVTLYPESSALRPPAVTDEIAFTEVTDALERIKEADYRKVAKLRKAVQEAFRLSPEDARAWVMSLPERGVFLTAYRELGRLEAEDPESAVAQMDSMDDGAGLEFFYSGMISGLSMEDPAYAMDLLSLNREAFPSVGSLESIVIQSTLSGNPRLALLAIRQKLPHDEQPRFFYQTYSHWAAMNVEEALADLESRGKSRALSVGAVGLFERWARMDRPGFEQWFSSNPDSRFARQAQTARAKISPRTDPVITESRIEVPIFESQPNGE